PPRALPLAPRAVTRRRMLDLRHVAQNFESVLQRLRTRGGELDLTTFQKLVEERRALHIELESLSHRRNEANEQMKKKVAADPKAIEKLRGEMRAVSQEIKDKEARLKSVEEELERILLVIPNIPDASVPIGKGPEDNRVEREWGQKPSFGFVPRQHFEIGERLGMLEFEHAAKVSGSRFVFYRGLLARLERALISFMLDAHLAKGYVELLPPYLVNRASMIGTGQLPKFEEDAFKTAGPAEFFLI